MSERVLATPGAIVELGNGSRITYRATTQQTEGTFALLEYVLAPGDGAGPHRHSREDESFLVLSGELSVQIGEQQQVVAAGGFVRIPRGMRHSFSNRGSEPLTALIVLTPAGLEQFFLDVTQPGAVPGEIAARYGLEFE